MILQRLPNEETIRTPTKAVGEALRRHWLSSGVQTVLDFSVLVTAFVLSYLLRLDFQIPRKEWHYVLVQIPFVALLQFLALTLTGARDFVWRYTDMSHIKSFLYAALGSLLVVVVLRGTLSEAHQAWRVPFSVSFIDSILAFGGTFGLRILRRAVYEGTKRRGQIRRNGHGKKRRRVLLIGAGQAGVLAAKEIEGRGDLDLDIRGFIDDDRMKLRRSIVSRHKVLGATSALPGLVRSLQIDHVVITIAQASRQEIRRIVEICEQIPVRVRIIPGLYEILQGHVEVTRIRDVQVEDLLGRDPVRLDEENIRKFLTGKVVMVTGAGGSIGSELARQVAWFKPSGLLLVERAEFALFNINRELEESWPSLSLVPLIADVCEEARMRAIFKDYRPEVVLHAAAHKHVPMMETNPMEAVKNNVLATNLLGELAGEFGVEVFVLISTDKAVRPTSVMGASKRVAELVAQNLGQRFETRFVTVRFGNVIGSAGSVIPIFQEQIRKGGPVTVTHPDMVRYFLTIPEAVQLVLQASAMAHGGEIYILDMGEPVRILDLAKDTITLSGFKPFEDIDIVFTGIRPGEKLFEELEMTEEHLAKTRHPKIFIGKIGTYPDETVRDALQQLAILSQDGQEQDLRRFFNELLPEARLRICSDTVTAPAEFAISAAGGD
jgi:FlaA1/EpsC-like NDP-sugar epimerase